MEAGGVEVQADGAGEGSTERTDYAHQNGDVS